MNLNINNEYDRLVKVALAPVNKEYLEQQKQLMNILKKYNIEMVMARKCNNAKYQMFIRDPFVVIGDRILISKMKDPIRKLEYGSANKILDKIDNFKKIYLSDDVVIEGGDIIVHNNVIFVGQNGNRTNKKGLEFLKKIFSSNYKIIPLFMINPNKNIPLVHLDCLFNPISANTAILYKEGLDEKSLNKIKMLFPNIIYVDDEEQNELATNVLSLGNNVIIVQKRHDKLIRILKDNGFKVEIMDIYDTVKDTGYSRCLTCPLERIGD